MTSQEIVIQNAQVGDLLEIERGVYKHWAVYIGNGEVVHLTGVKDQESTNENANPGGLFTVSGASYKKAVAKREGALGVIGSSNVKINNDTCEGCTPLPSEEIRKNALACANQKAIKYNMLLRNCEHFATFCRYEKALSRQSERATDIAAGIAIGLSVSLGVGLIVLFALKNK